MSAWVAKINLTTSVRTLVFTAVGRYSASPMSTCILISLLLKGTLYFIKVNSIQSQRLARGLVCKGQSIRKCSTVSLLSPHLLLGVV